MRKARLWYAVITYQTSAHCQTQPAAGIDHCSTRNHGCQSTAPPGCRSTCIHHTCPPPQAHAAIASHTDGRRRVNNAVSRREQRPHVHGRRARREFIRRLFIAVARDALLAEAPEDAGTTRRVFRPDLSLSVRVRVHPGGHRRGRFVRGRRWPTPTGSTAPRVAASGNELCGCIRFSGRARGERTTRTDCKPRRPIGQGSRSYLASSSLPGT